MTSSGAARRIHLGPLANLPVEGAMGFRVEVSGRPREIFVVRRGERCHAYVNSCPHTGITLDWEPNRFLDSSGTLIQCSTHGALFRIEDGLCIYGPCANRSLTPLAAEIEEEQIYLLI